TQRDNTISALFQEGKSQRAISRIVGITQPAVRKRLLTLGLLSVKTRSDNLPQIHNMERQRARHYNEYTSICGTALRARFFPTRNCTTPRGEPSRRVAAPAKGAPKIPEIPDTTGEHSAAPVLCF